MPVIFDNFRFLYDWCVDTDLSHLYDFVCPYHIAHVTTHEDDESAPRGGEQV